MDRSRRHERPRGPAEGSAGQRQLPNDADLSTASREELVRLGSALDGVTIEYREDPFPVPGTRADKRTERKVARWFLLAALAGLVSWSPYLFWPDRVRPARQSDGHLLYALYTPIIGVLPRADDIRSSASGRSRTRRDLLPHEVAMQQRHIGVPPRSTGRPPARSWPTPLPAAGIGRRP